MSLFLAVALALVFGLLFTRVTKHFNLPDVTAYLVAGVLIGPFCLGLIGVEGLGFTSTEMVHQVSFLGDLALGFIAFEIGNEFRLEELKHTGRQAVIVGILQAVITTLLVDAVLIGMVFVLGPDKLSIPAAITLGAIASATAPAATLMVIKQYKAKGKVTDILLPVVALDDAVGLALFAISFGIAKALSGGSLDMVSIVVNPLVEIIGSLAIGAVMGWIMTHLEKLFHSNRNRTSLTIGLLLLAVGLSMIKFHIGPVHVGFSSLLVCMMMGTIFCNLSDISEDIMNRTDKWSAPIMALFFVLSGAELDLSVLASGIVVLIGVMYILSRSAGKCMGATLSCKLAKCDATVTKWLGITLLPQAGVALGMSATAASLPGDGTVIRNIVLFGVLIYELFGPSLTKMALTKSGDIVEKESHRTRDRFAKKEA